MLKKFLAGVFVLLMISAQASAMRLELFPQPIGKIFFDGKEFKVEGATKFKGNSSKGAAMFGDKSYPRTEADQKRYGTSGGDRFYGEKFFFHFDAAKNLSSFGDRDKKNSVPVDTLGETEIFLVNNSAGHNLFLLRKDGDAIKVLGQRGGKWIEQLDVPALRAKYDIGQNFSLEKFFTDENQIIFRYKFQERVVDVICRWHAVNEKFYTEAIEQ